MNFYLKIRARPIRKPKLKGGYGIGATQNKWDWIVTFEEKQKSGRVKKNTLFFDELDLLKGNSNRKKR